MNDFLVSAYFWSRRYKRPTWFVTVAGHGLTFARYNEHCMYFSIHLDWMEGVVASKPPRALLMWPKLRIMRMSLELRRQCGDAL